MKSRIFRDKREKGRNFDRNFEAPNRFQRIENRFDSRVRPPVNQGRRPPLHTNACTVVDKTEIKTVAEVNKCELIRHEQQRDDIIRPKSDVRPVRHSDVRGIPKASQSVSHVTLGLSLIKPVNFTRRPIHVVARRGHRACAIAAVA